jgi:cobalt-zinc-cadmium efflux system protein
MSMTTVATYQELRSRLTLALAVNAVIITAEFIGGIVLDSIGLMSDAASSPRF